MKKHLLKNAFLFSMALSNGLASQAHTVVRNMEMNPYLRIATAPATASPMGLSIQVYAGTATLANLSVYGTGIKWYDAATAGNLLPSTTPLADNITYYATQTIGGIESGRLAVTTKKISTGSQVVTAGSTIASLTSTPSSGIAAQWYTAAQGGNALSGDTALTTGTYFAAQTERATSIPLGAGTGVVNTNGVTVDAAGNIYVIDGTAVKKMDANGANTVTLKDGFQRPISTAIDPSGNIYVVDEMANSIVKLNAAGTVITTFPLDGSFEANRACAIALDPSGNMFVAYYQSGTVKKLDTTGNILATFTGGFSFPRAIRLDAAGNIYVTSGAINPELGGQNGSIVKLDSAGHAIATFGELASSSVEGVALDASGNIYAAYPDESLIKEMDATGNVITTFAGADYNFSDIVDVFVDASGNIYVSDFTNTIKKITFASNRAAVAVTVLSSATQTVCNGGTVAELTSTPIDGATTQWFAAATGGLPLTDNTALTTQTYYIGQTAGAAVRSLGSNLVNTNGVTVDTAGNIYVIDGTAVKKMDADGRNTVTLKDGFQRPISTAVDPSGNILVVDEMANAIVKLNATGNIITTYPLDGTFETNRACAIALDPSGNMYVAYYQSGTVKKLNASGNIIATFTGGFAFPRAIRLDAAGNIFVTSGPTNPELGGSNGSIVKLDNTGQAIATFGQTDPSSVEGVALDALGNIYAAYPEISTIKKMDANGNIIATFAGTDYNFSDIVDVTVDGAGNIYVSDFTGTIKKIRQNTNNRVAVTVNVLPLVTTPTGDAEQMLQHGKTVSDIVITNDPDATVTWYSTSEDALAGTNALAADAPIELGDYYAMQTVSGCICAAPLKVTITSLLGVNQFDTTGLKFYPNPVKDGLNVSYNNQIDSIEVFNLLGQNMISVSPNVANTRVDMTNLPTGTYLMKLSSQGKSTTVKVVKN